MLRYASEKEKTNRILDLTNLTEQEFEQMVEPFEQAYGAIRSQCAQLAQPTSSAGVVPVWVLSPARHPTNHDQRRECYW